MRKFREYALALLLLTVTLPECLLAFGESDARAMGIARSYTAVARGIECVGWNPANLALEDGPHISFRLPAIGIRATSNFIDRSQYDRYNGSFLTEKDKNDIIEGISGNTVDFDAESEFKFLGFSYGPYAVLISAIAASNIDISKDVLDLLLFGNELNRVYSFSDTIFGAWTAVSVSVSAAKSFNVPQFGRLSVGATAKYLRGLGWVDTPRSSGSIVTNEGDVDLEGDIITRRSSGGTGFAFDLGLSSSLAGGWTAGISLVNLVGRINWDKDNEEKRSEYIGVLTVGEESEQAESDTVVSIGSFRSRYPPFLRLGVARNFRKDLLVAADYHQGFGDVAGSLETLRASLGLEYMPIDWLKLRTGFAVGGFGGTSISAGMGIGYGGFEINIATGGVMALLPAWGKKFAFSADIGLHF